MEPLQDYERRAKIRRINTLISACKLTPNRPDLLQLWGAQEFEDLFDEELVEFGCFMEEAYRCRTTTPTDQVRRLRSQVLTHLNKLGKYVTANDWSVVNAYLLQKKICGRLLYMLSAEELQALVRKLRAIGDKSPIEQAPAPPTAGTDNTFYCYGSSTGGYVC